MPLSCDIVIPLYNNETVIGKTLQALFVQTGIIDWKIRIIVTDDGSTDHSLAIVRELAQPSPWPLDIITGSHRGPAGARNQGVQATTGFVVMLLGADIILRPTAVSQHLRFHEHQSDSKDAALGMVKWDPRLQPSRLMEWMTHGGQQNDYDSLLGQAQADPAHFFYGSHLSLKRQQLQNTPFSQAFTGYGWEDLDYGRKLKQKGIRLHVLHQALGLHHHYYTPTAIARRQQSIGRSFITYYNRHQAELGETMKNRRVHRWVRRAVVTAGMPLILYGLTRLSLALSFTTPRLYVAFTSSYFWQGILKVAQLFPKKY